ncbi:MAG TPA: YceK/YidQ family lipoprotein [Verrucomicrobiae bacterium]|nr:YceK/YidQ family lipoprotein [Verrucomicrobiae bacterium]
MRPFTTAAALSVGLVLLSGCASIAARTQGRATRVYPGVRGDAYYLAHPSKADFPWLQWMNVIDLPFSAVLDTLLWPCDACRLSRQSAPPPEEK